MHFSAVIQATLLYSLRSKFKKERNNINNPISSSPEVKKMQEKYGVKGSGRKRQAPEADNTPVVKCTRDTTSVSPFFSEFSSLVYNI